MNALKFYADVDGRPQPVLLAFGAERDLIELRRWRSPASLRAHPHVSDALEYARLASKRWAYYHRHGETAASLAALREAIRRNRRAEVAFMLIARATWRPDPRLIGLAYCRRTWCHRFVVDFVAVHPRVIGQLRERVRGIGTGIFHGLIQLADVLGVEAIWGEATANSAPFYEKILGTESVLDQFHIRGKTMDHCRHELARIHRSKA